MRITIALFMITLASCALLASDETNNTANAVLRRIAYDQNLGAQLPLDLQFRDDTGQAVRLQNYFQSGRPVILILGYYGCPMLCGAVLRGATGCLKLLPLNAGRDFEVVMVSIDPAEKPELAAEKKREYLKDYNRPGAESGWHFLTGDGAAVKTLAQSAGFRYMFDEHSRQYAHPSGILIATPKGQISRYFLGIDYAPRDLRLALVEASQESIGTITDQILLLCYRYDPSTGRYGFAIINAIRAGGALTVGALAWFIIMSIRRERTTALNS